MNILISSLGNAPGVVTGTVDAIKEVCRDVIHKVITISTSERDIINVGVNQILRPEFENYYQPSIEYCNVPISASDIRDVNDNEEFLSKFVKLFIKSINNEKITGIYISLAGGRKTMSSLVLIGCQLIVSCYKDNEIFNKKFKEITHLIIDDLQVEREGIIEYLRDAKDTDFFKKCMHPRVLGQNRVHLIRLSGIFKNADTLRNECQNLRRENVDNLLLPYIRHFGFLPSQE